MFSKFTRGASSSSITGGSSGALSSTSSNTGGGGGASNTSSMNSSTGYGSGTPSYSSTAAASNTAAAITTSVVTPNPIVINTNSPILGIRSNITAATSTSNGLRSGSISAASPYSSTGYNTSASSTGVTGSIGTLGSLRDTTNTYQHHGSTLHYSGMGTPVGGFTKPNGTPSNISVGGSSVGASSLGSMGGMMGGVMAGVMGSSSGSSSVMSSVMGSSASALQAMEKGPLAQQYEIGKLVATGGPSFVWKIYEGYRKSDGKVSTIY